MVATWVLSFFRGNLKLGQRLYESVGTALALQFARGVPLRMAKSRHAMALLSDERFVDLAANLRYFREMYDAILAGLRERSNGLASVRGTPERRGQRLYGHYIQAQRDEVVAMLQRMAIAKR
jgi:hypothetical protein